MNTIRNCWIIIKPGIIPLILAISYILFIFCYRLLGLPSPETLGKLFSHLLTEYGTPILIVASLIEGVFMISFYFPGSFVILLSILVSDKSIKSILFICIYSLVGFLMSNIINYFLGLFGYYKALLFLGKGDTVKKMEIWLSKNKYKTLFFASVHPNILSFAFVSCGIAKQKSLPLFVFSLFSLSFWISLWVIIFLPLLKIVNIQDPNQAWYIVILLLVWSIVLIGRELIRKKTAHKKI